MSDIPPGPPGTAGTLDAEAPADDSFHGRVHIDFPFPRFTGMGGVLSQTLTVYGQNFGLIFMLALVLLLPPALIEAAVTGLSGQTPGQPPDPVVVAVSISAGLLNLGLTLLMIPALIYGIVFRLRENRTPTLSACLAWGVRKWLPTLGWAIVVLLLLLATYLPGGAMIGVGVALMFADFVLLGGLLVFAGIVLIIVAALAVCTWFFLLYPTITIEDSRAGNAFGRCLALARGHAWPICGLVVVTLLVMIAFGLFLGLVNGIAQLAGGNLWPLIALANWLAELIWPLMVVASVLTYLGIRAKEQVTTCPHCEYPLAGNTTGYCPECGERLPDNAITDLPYA